MGLRSGAGESSDQAIKTAETALCKRGNLAWWGDRLAIHDSDGRLCRAIERV